MYVELLNWNIYCYLTAPGVNQWRINKLLYNPRESDLSVLSIIINITYLFISTIHVAGI